MQNPQPDYVGRMFWLSMFILMIAMVLFQFLLRCERTNRHQEMPPADVCQSMESGTAPRSKVEPFQLFRLFGIVSPGGQGPGPGVGVIFGSCVRGEAKPGSDLDLVVVLPEVENTRDIAISIRRLLAGLPVPKDVVVATPEIIEARRGSGWHILSKALNEGRVVYAAENGHERGGT